MINLFEKLIVLFIFVLFAAIIFFVGISDNVYPATVDYKNLKDDIPINTILLEAQGEEYEGMLAVACVIRHRADQRRLSYDAVCMQPKQFSCYNHGYRDADVTKEILDIAKKAWKDSEFNYNDLDANLYCRTDATPRWRFSPKVKFVKRIGEHLFFKEERN